MSENKVREDVLPESVAPNVALAIAPNGYIRAVFGYDLITTAFYCDGGAARVLAQHLIEAADEFDRVWEQIRNAATAPVPATEGQFEMEFTDSDEIPLEFVQHDVDVEDAIALSENPRDFD